MHDKILIVDDEKDIVAMLGSFFESKGFFVLSAANGADALKQVERQPDIILLDINMPELDGLEVCRRIRDYISCPILFLTAHIEDTDKVKGFAVGGDDYIVKPFSLMELNEKTILFCIVKGFFKTFDTNRFTCCIAFIRSFKSFYLSEQICLFIGVGIFFSRRIFAKHRIF